jgi:hypothetical protein
MRWPAIGILALSLGMLGCASMHSPGEPAKGFDNPAVGDAFLPLTALVDLIEDGYGAAIVIEPGVAVTAAHNANLIDRQMIIGTSAQYDLLFFRTPARATLPVERPTVGEAVIAYGQGRDGDLRKAGGPVRLLDTPVQARCPDCQVQHAFTFEVDAGEGFSGGPVVSADGHLLGMVFGFNDEPGPGGKRLMYAYDMDRIAVELARIRSGLAQTAAH